MVSDEKNAEDLLEEEFVKIILERGKKKFGKYEDFVALMVPESTESRSLYNSLVGRTKTGAPRRLRLAEAIRACTLLDTKIQFLLSDAELRLYKKRQLPASSREKDGPF